MFKKIFAIGIILLFFGIIIENSTNAEDNFIEIVLDQYQHECYSADNQGPQGIVRSAQSFRSSLDNIVKIAIRIYKSGSPPGDVKVSIRQTLTDDDLVSASIPAKLFPGGWSTKEFDFANISVTPELTYYIVFEAHTDPEGDNWIGWCETWSENGTIYPRGKHWLWADSMSGWYTLDNTDHWFETYGYDKKPNSPTINGSKSGKPRNEYNYAFMATDPEDHDLYYMIDWGDGSNSGWIGPSSSGFQIIESHIWSTKGTFLIQAKAKDVYDLESDWSTFEISMPKNKIINPFERFLDNHPYMFPLLRHLMEL